MIKIKSSTSSRLVFVAIVAFGITLRSCNLDSPNLWVDEAESSINALTILEHGYPSDQYLGLPIFENTLLREWPESEEYEFRDLSYSDRGLAVYHGWLPLYSIAASLSLFGITPDHDTQQPRVRHGRDEWHQRTLAPRIPSIVFSLVFLVAFYLLAGELYGRDAGWAALVAAAIADGLVNQGRWARYYSATLALVTLCGLSIWRLTQRQRWRDFLLAAIVFVMLFHTHTLSFFIMMVVFTATSPVFLRAEKIHWKLLFFTGIVATGTVPWAIYTGFLDAAVGVPKAWSLLDFPSDLIRFLISMSHFTAPAALGLMWLIVGLALPRHIPARFMKPFTENKESFFFLVIWGIVAFCSFLFFIPAASFYLARFQLVLVVPGLLLLAIVFAAASRTVTLRYSGSLTVVLMVGTLFAAQSLSFEHLHSKPGQGRFHDLIEIMGEWDLPPGTRIYSSPNDHLLLTYYSGLPVQSIAPVRKAFLDRMDRDIIIIDTKSSGPALPVNETLQETRRMGVALSEKEAKELWKPLNVALLQKRLEARVAKLWPPGARALTPLERRLAEKQSSHNKALLREDALNIPILRGYDMESDEDWWTVFVYRYANVEARWRQNLNYFDRVRQSVALILPWGWVIYDCGYDGPAVFTSETILQQTYLKASRLR